MMNSPREAKALSWPPRGYDDLIYVHPDGKKIVYGDVVIIREGYSACFAAGGEVYWFRDPQRYTIGYDDRTEAEILRGVMMGEDMDGLPLLVDTDLVFCCLKPFKSYTLESDNYLMLNRIVGVKPSFQLRLSVADDEQLLRSVSPEGRAIDQILDAFNRCLKQQLQDSLDFLFDDETSAEEIRLQINQPEWLSQFLTQLKNQLPCSDFGIYIDSFELVNWNLWNGFCEECGAPIRPRAGRCPNNHRIRRCPVCNDPVYDGMCLTHKHDILFCPICGKYVVAKDGHCRTHPEVKRSF